MTQEFKGTTAKEKATEIKSFYRTITYDSKDKVCAINHVEGVIEEHERYFGTNIFPERLDFWKEVLTHLKQM